MNFRSHSKKEIQKAQNEGKEIFELDTDNFGEDDVLIGSHTDCVEDVITHYGFQAFPTNWELSKIDYQI